MSNIAEFVAFDTEGIDINGQHTTILLASSKGNHIYNRNGLSLDEMLNFLYENSGQINVWFAMGYDINMIFRTLSPELQADLFKTNKQIKYTSKINSNYNPNYNYRIKYIPKKILRIYRNKDKRAVNHYDVYGFFQTSFLQALKDWKIPYSDVLERGKVERSDFNKWSDEDIIKYNNEECVLLQQLMNNFNDKLIQNNIFLKSYHGAGSIASYLLKQIHADEHKTVHVTEKSDIYRRHAYFGGRIELFKRGEFENIHHYDINSAYPDAITNLPSLNHDNWQFYDKVFESDLESDSFGIVYAECLDKDMVVLPFPYRYKNGYVVFPQKSKGYYHIIEILAALKKGYNIKLGAGMILQKPHNYPFKKYINDLMIRRLQYKSIGDFAHVPLKLGANSFYGKLAQRPVNSKQGEPPFRDLIWAGYVTAHTRSKLLDYCEPKDTILMATDGLFSLSPLKCPIGKNLGQWEYTQHEKGIFIMAGIYSLLTGDKWRHKVRGYKELDVLKIYDLLKKYPHDSIPLTDRRFVGIKYCVTVKKYNACNFVDIPREIDWNNNIKRIFLPHGNSVATDDLNGQDISFIYRDKLPDAIENDLAEKYALSETDE